MEYKQEGEKDGKERRTCSKEFKAEAATSDKKQEKSISQTAVAVGD
jgi:hypothetical protein